MSSQLFTKLLLVNHIPKIAGIYPAQDLIKQYAFTGEYELHKAENFSVRFFLIHQEIILAFSRYSIPDDECHWGFSTQMSNTSNRIVQLQAVNCFFCGEYKSISHLSYNIRIPCRCAVEP